jgi:hypothetical protein
MKSFTIQLPDDLYDDIVKKAAVAKGYAKKIQTRDVKGAITFTDETRTEEQFLQDFYLKELQDNYVKGSTILAAQEAGRNAAQAASDKLKASK